MYLKQGYVDDVCMTRSRAELIAATGPLPGERARITSVLQCQLDP